MNPPSPAATVLDEVATWAGITTKPASRGATAILFEGRHRRLARRRRVASALQQDGRRYRGGRKGSTDCRVRVSSLVDGGATRQVKCPGSPS